MQLKDVWFAIADFLEWTFHILPPLGNIPNYIFIVIGFLAFFFWMAEMIKHKRTGEQ